MQIPILRIPYSDDSIDYITGKTSEILKSGYLAMGPYTAQFEGAFAEFAGAKAAVSCTNGTTAIELILRGLGIEGRSVIVPTNTFLATAYAVMQSGNRLIFADSEADTLCLDVEDVKRRITDDTAAVILVHIGGLITPAVDELKALCHEKGIHLIEDCAHAHGCTIDGRQAGTLGVAGAFSFFPTKVLTTGEGGMVTTNDENLAAQIKIIRNHGKNPELGNRMSVVASNYRISEITAMLGVEQMNRATEIVAERQRIAAYYDANIGKVPMLTPVNLANNVSSSYYKYMCWLDPSVDRAWLKTALKEEHGVSLTGEVYVDLCHTEPLWQDYTLCGMKRETVENACVKWPACGCGGNIDSNYPGAEYAAKHHVCLPLYPGLSEDELSYVINSLSAVLNAKAA